LNENGTVYVTTKNMSLNITLKHDSKTRQLNIWFSKMEKLKTIHCTCLKRNTDQA